jgi:hypothetical protein
VTARHLKEELLKQALAEIDPPEQKNASCCKSINEALRLVDMVRALDEAPAPGEFKKHVKAVADSLVKMKLALAKSHKITQYLVFRGLPGAVGPVDKDRFLEDVDRLISTCGFTIKHLQERPGSRRWSAAKIPEWCADAGFSPALYYKRKRLGLPSPRETNVGRRTIITEPAAEYFKRLELEASSARIPRVE